MTRRRTSFLAGAAALVLLLGACGGDDEPPAAEPEATEATEDETEEGGAGVPQVAMVDNDFAPSMLELEGGQDVTIPLRNNGENPHTFTIDELDVDTGIVDSGASAEATFTLPDSGEIEFYCTVHGREVMSGTITLE